MDLIEDFIELAVRFLPALATLGVAIGVLTLVNRGLRRQWKDRPDAQFRFQLIMLALTIAAIVAFILALPMNDATRGQLLSLIGILLSATIALSSTTFMGNIMAGIMLKVVKSARPGDFITVADLTGRVTEMDLLHTDIQTEFRDLVTTPNLYMVTQPLKVVRASGTIITAEVSLGYDVAHTRVCELLREAATAAGLQDPFAQVRELGDFSVVYRVAGLLEDVTSLISARSALRRATLDALHGAGIEIVSPNFMNQRNVESNGPFIPQILHTSNADNEARAESLAFDKAEEAASIEQIRKELDKADTALSDFMKGKPKELDEADSRTAKGLERRRDLLAGRLQTAEKHAAAHED